MVVNFTEDNFLLFQNPNDISYVFSGYAPMSVRLAQILHRPGWRSITEVLNKMSMPTVNEIQQIPVGLRKRSKSCEYVHVKESVGIDKHSKSPGLAYQLSASHVSDPMAS